MSVIDIIVAALPFFYLNFIGCITPGPNNVMLTASGMNFGYLKTVPHMLGIFFGFVILLWLCAFGVGAAYEAYPPVQVALKVLGCAYLLYLAYRIFRAGRVGLNKASQEAQQPLTFWEAFGFQYINPKAIVFGLAAVNLLPADMAFWMKAVIILFTAVITCGISLNVWTLFGKMVAELFRDDKIRQIINTVLALLLIATIPMMIL